jgi:hypothetical protein
MPGWLQAFVKVNPVTYLSDAGRALLVGGPAAALVERSLLWALGIFAVVAPLAVAMYRRRTRPPAGSRSPGVLGGNQNQFGRTDPGDSGRLITRG